MKAPLKPTVVGSEPVHDKYVIQFAPELSDLIKKDGKVKTYRFGSKYDYLKVGDKVELSEYGTNRHIANAVIKNKEYTLFVDLPLDLAGHEVYKSKDHQKKFFSSYYKYIGRKVKDNDQFIILTFDLIP